MLKKLLFILFISAFMLDLQAEGKVRGSITEISDFYFLKKVSLRVDCKNMECETKYFYFMQPKNLKNPWEDINYVILGMVIDAQEHSQKVMITYDNVYFLNILRDIYSISIWQK